MLIETNTPAVSGATFGNDIIAKYEIILNEIFFEFEVWSNYWRNESLVKFYEEMHQE